MQANKNIQKLTPYLSIPHKIWNCNQSNVLKLDWNEATIPPSPCVIESVTKFLVNGNLNWYPNTKNLSLLDKIAKYTKQTDSSFVELFEGSDCAHECIVDVFLERSDKIGIISPTYDNFRSRANGVGIETLSFSLDENFNLDFDNLECFIHEKRIKLLYLCNPNNPTGKAYDIQKIKSLIINNPNVMFVIDEAYYEFTGQSVCDLVQQCNNLIITRTFSKAFALASFRIGYIISHPENINSINKLRNPKNVPMLSQVAAQAALEDLQYTKDYIDEVSCARKEFVKFLNTLTTNRGGVFNDSVANFVLIQNENISLFVGFLEKEGIFIRNYSHLISKNCRISIGTRNQMSYVAEKIQEFARKQGGFSLV